MVLHTLFFDAAGTLIFPAQPVGQVYSVIAARFGVKAEPEAVMKAFRAAWQASSPPLHPPGAPPADDDRSWWRRLVGDVFARVQHVPLSDALLEGLFDALYLHYAQPSAWSVFDDVVHALSDLARDHQLLVLSNFDRRLRSILAGHDLMRFFDRVIISSEVGAAKPHARMFEAALEAAGCGEEHCLHIGDDFLCDIEGAQSRGIQAFRVERPGNGLDTLVNKVRSRAYSGLRRPLA